jgi:hypothetical protein
MKKFLTFTLCVLLLIALPFSVYAEEETTETVGETTETALETTETVGETTETSTETSTGIVAPPPSKTPEEGAENLLSVKFEEWVLPNLEEISVVITLILTAFYNMRKHKLLNKSIGVMNNNTVAVAENNKAMMGEALQNISTTANIVTQYDARIAAMLEAHQATVADRDRLEKELHELKAFLRSAAEANLEFSNELAELLNLANIPNFKKEEIGARHLAAVNSIKTAEEEALHTEEVIENGKENGEEA